MSAEPVTLMVARRVAHGRYQDFMTWLREGEQLAADFTGYLGSGVLAPPAHDNEFQIVFRFADAATMAAWEHSASRSAWLVRWMPGSAAPTSARHAGSRASPYGWRSSRSRWPSTCCSATRWSSCRWCSACCSAR